MELSVHCLMEKEIIVACSGKKLGFPKDFILDCECGRITAIVVCRKGFSLFRQGDLRIPWCDVERVGEDVIWICKEPACV